jgi:hypothetical protein
LVSTGRGSGLIRVTGRGHIIPIRKVEVSARFLVGVEICFFVGGLEVRDLGDELWLVEVKVVIKHAVPFSRSSIQSYAVV